ncbi:MAG: hypothetical protein J3K34DRAFT_510078 [Monoraphidium minutum]|nr:MAG: hypothetical protein J3K34DRAFT_510078 [Monoraphidium minutum]
MAWAAPVQPCCGAACQRAPRAPRRTPLALAAAAAAVGPRRPPQPRHSAAWLEGQVPGALVSLYYASRAGRAAALAAAAAAGAADTAGGGAQGGGDARVASAPQQPRETPASDPQEQRGRRRGARQQARPPPQQQQRQQHELAPAAWLPYPSGPDPRAASVCSTLGISEEDAELLALAAPEALGQPEATLAAHWSELRELLPAPPATLARAAAADPGLLLSPRAAAASALAAGAAALRAPRRRLAGPRGGELRFALATRGPGALLARVRMAADLLQIEPDAARRLLLAAPRLLVARAAAVRETAEALEQAPAPLELPAGAVFAAAASLQSDLRLSEQGLAVALRRAPAALAAPAGRAGALAGALGARMGVGEEVALDLLLQEPALLAYSPGAVAASLDAITSAFSLDPEQLLQASGACLWSEGLAACGRRQHAYVQTDAHAHIVNRPSPHPQVVEFDPSALLVSPGVLGSRVRHFRALAGSCPAWRHEFSQLMSQPANVARALNLGEPRLARLAYLAATGRQGLISMRAALTLGRAQFRRAYPRFDEWSARRRGGGGGGAARGARAAGGGGAVRPQPRLRLMGGE